MKFKLHILAAVGTLAVAASGASLAQNTVTPGQSTMTPASPTTSPTHPTEGSSTDRLPAARGTAGDTTDQAGHATPAPRADAQACAKLAAQERIDCMDKAARERGAAPPSHKTDSPAIDSSRHPAGTRPPAADPSSGTRTPPSQDSGAYGGTGSSSSTK